MRSIDIHAHYSPRCVYETLEAGKSWHGLTLERREGGLQMLVRGQKSKARKPKASWDVAQRMQDMNSLGVDMHILSAQTFLYGYELPTEVCVKTSHEINADIAETVNTHPDRFGGLATLPMQDVKSAIKELEHAVGNLGLQGAMIADNVNGRLYDDPEFLPFFQAADEAGALLFIHQFGGSSFVKDVNPRYHLSNTVGNPLDRTLTFASLVYGGVMDKCPTLKVCLAHGGGYVCHGIGRMDRGWQARPEAREHISKPPSTYLRRFYYDSLTHSEQALRYLIDTVGIDRVVLGTDWPADMMADWPVATILAMESLTDDEKERILWRNLQELLGMKEVEA
jgi:aminocarboxymuconate-semialdehyde decarboxylase